MHLFSSTFASSFSFTVISCLLFMKASFTNCITTEAKLRNQLLLGYDRWTRPVAYSNDVVNVTFAAAIYQERIIHKYFIEKSLSSYHELKFLPLRNGNSILIFIFFTSKEVLSILELLLKRRPQKYFSKFMKTV